MQCMGDVVCWIRFIGSREMSELPSTETQAILRYRPVVNTRTLGFLGVR